MRRQPSKSQITTINSIKEIGSNIAVNIQYAGKITKGGVVHMENTNKKFWQKAFYKRYMILTDGKIEVFPNINATGKKPLLRLELDRNSTFVDIDNYKKNSNTFGVRVNPAASAPASPTSPALSPRNNTRERSRSRSSSAVGDNLTSWFFVDTKSDREEWQTKITKAINDTRQGAVRLTAEVCLMVEKGQLKEVTNLVTDCLFNVNAKVYLPQQFVKLCEQYEQQGLLDAKAKQSPIQSPASTSVAAQEMLPASPLTSSYLETAVPKRKLSVKAPESPQLAVEDDEGEEMSQEVEKDDEALLKTGYIHFDTMLHIAAMHGHLKLVQALISNQATVDSVNAQGKTPLVRVFDNTNSTQKLEVVKALIEAGADVNRADVDDNTALLLAAEQKDWPMVQFLISKGAVVNQQSSKDGSTTLIHAAKGRQLDTVRLLISKGADLNVKDVDDYTAADILVEDERENIDAREILKELLNNKAAINVEDKKLRKLYIPTLIETGLLESFKVVISSDAELANNEFNDDNTISFNVLNYSLVCKQEEIALYLVTDEQTKTVVDINKEQQLVDGAACTPFHLALLNGLFRAAAAILSHEKFDIGKPSGSDSTVPLMLAVKYKAPSSLREQVVAKMAASAPEAPAEGSSEESAPTKSLFSVTNKSGQTMLHVAAETNDVDLLKLLLQNGMDPKQITSLGQGILSAACANGHLEATKYLVEEVGLDPVGTLKEHYIENSYPPLQSAVLSGNVDLVKYLIEEKGVSPDYSKRELQMKPIHLAALKGKTAVAIYLIEKGADLTPTINLTDDKGINALHLACGYGQDAIVEAMLKSGRIDHTIRTTKGLSALDFAVRRLQFKVIKTLSDHGATSDQLTLQLAIQTGNGDIVELIEKQQNHMAGTPSSEATPTPLTTSEATPVPHVRTDSLQ